MKESLCAAELQVSASFEVLAMVRKVVSVALKVNLSA
jgi:hypothetical protein